MRPCGSWILSPLLIMGLSGCGINALRLEGANQVSLTANAVVTQSNAALDNISLRRQTASQALIASDPSCPPVSEIYIFVPIGPPDPMAKVPPLCASGENELRNGYRTKLLHFSSASAERLKPTVLMIAAISEYGAAYRKIVERPKTDVSAIITSAAQKAADAKAIADSVLSDPLPPIPNLESKQAKSAMALLDFLTGLADEARRAKDIGKVYKDKAPQIDGMLDELSDQLSDWTSATTLAYAQIETVALRSGYRNERDRLTFEGRRAFLELIQKSDLEQNGIKRTANTLSEAIGELKAANQNLGNLLDGKLTSEQRAREAKINEDRLFKALKLSVEAATSWGVI